MGAGGDDGGCSDEFSGDLVWVLRFEGSGDPLGRDGDQRRQSLSSVPCCRRRPGLLFKLSADLLRTHLFDFWSSSLYSLPSLKLLQLWWCPWLDLCWCPCPSLDLSLHLSLGLFLFPFPFRRLPVGFKPPPNRGGPRGLSHRLHGQKIRVVSKKGGGLLVDD